MNIKDNPDLLQKLMQDMDSAPEIYRPTPYWQGYVKRIHDRIKNVGLVNFRDDWEISKGHGQIIAKDFKEIELRKDFVAKRALEILNPGYDVKLFKK